MRPLTEVERLNTNKGLVRVKKDLHKANDNLTLSLATKDYNEAKRKYEDATRDILREQRDEQDSVALKYLDQEVVDKEIAVKKTEDQLKYGVEEKESKKA